MAVREMHAYIDGTSALKMGDPQARFTVLRGNGRSSDDHQNAYFTDDLRIAYAASGLREASSSLKYGSASGADRIPSSFGAIFVSCAATLILGLLIVL